MTFYDFNFEDSVSQALEAMGFDKPTPIQQQAIPAIMENKDMIACAQTGTGKTAAFVLPILNSIAKNGSSGKVSTLVIVPTRELAMQIDQQIEGFSYFTNATSIAIYGGGDGKTAGRRRVPGTHSPLFSAVGVRAVMSRPEPGRYRFRAFSGEGQQARRIGTSRVASPSRERPLR